MVDINKLSLNDRKYHSYTTNDDGEVAVRTTAVLEAGDIEIGAVELKDGTSDNRVTVDSSGALKVTGGASSVNAEFKSPDDFSATYTSSTTITLSGLPFTIGDSSQIQYITVIPSSGDAATYVNGANGITLTVSSNVLTIAGVTTPFASGDVYQVGINSQKKAYDASTNSTMTSPLKNVWNQYTDAEPLVTAQDLTATQDDLGSIIDVRTYTKLGLFIDEDVNNSETVTLYVLGKSESDGTYTYEIDGISEKTLWTTGASDANKYYEFDVGSVPFIQLQVKAGTVGATAGDLSVSIVKRY